MTWFRIDDKFHDHRKVRALGKSRPGAVGLWTLAGTWSADTMSDGFVPDQIVARWDARKRLAAALCRVGLWHEVEVNGEHGYQFHQWDEHQPTKEEILDKRQKRAAAGRLGGVKSGQVRRSKNEASASGLVEPPTRPVPIGDQDTRTSVPVSNTHARGASGPNSSAAYRLVDRIIGRSLTSATRTALAIEVAQLMPEVDEPTIVAALGRWTTRTGIGPRMLPGLVDDIRKEARGATTRAAPTGPPASPTDAYAAEFLAAGKRDQPPPLRALPGGAS